MGFIKEIIGSAIDAVGGTLSDQFLDFLVPQPGAPATAAFIPAVRQVKNAGRGGNTGASDNIITNGSKIIVPEGMALVTFDNGRLTGLVAETGAYTFSTTDPNAQSIFAGGGLMGSVIRQSWERFKTGGLPASQQMAFYVVLKELPNNRFGTQSEIYWDDAYIGAQVGAMCRGTYTLRVADPVLFVKNYVPAAYYTSASAVFDLADIDNDAASQLFNEVVSSLGSAFSLYTNDPAKGNRMRSIQADQVGFAAALAQAVENDYRWRADRGLEIVKVAMQAVEYDDDTKRLLSDVKKADALGGQRGASFMQQSVARGFEAAGSAGGAGAMAMMGMGMGAVGGSMGMFQQQQAQQPVQQQTQPQTAAPDPMETLLKYKQMLDAGLITPDDYEKAKAKVLGL